MSIQLGPKRLEILPGLIVVVRPVSERLRQNAARAYKDAYDADIEARGVVIAETDIDAVAMHAGNVAYALSLAVDGIMSWEGDIKDPDGNPADATPDNIRMLMDYVPAFRAFENAYVEPFLRDLSSKNGFSPSSNGPIARVGGKTTAQAASSPADSDAAKNG